MRIRRICANIANNDANKNKLKTQKSKFKSQNYSLKLKIYLMGLLRRFAPRNDNRLINIRDIAPTLRDIAPMLRDDVHKLEFFIHNSFKKIASFQSIETRFILLFPKLRGLRRRPI